MTVWVSDETNAAIARLSRMRPDLETGGAAFGWTHGPDTVIAAVSGPGRRAVRRRRVFELHPSDVAATARAVHLTSSGRYRFVGTWHTHPGGRGIPSATDRAAAGQLAADVRLALPEPTLLILGTSPEGRVASEPLRAWRWDAEAQDLNEADTCDCLLDGSLTPPAADLDSPRRRRLPHLS